MIFWELKLMLMNYKKIIIIFLAFFVLTITGVQFLKHIEGRGYLFEPFTVGVVNYDDFEQMGRIFSVYESSEKLSKTVNFLEMSYDEAEKNLIENTIPCYVIVPEGFASSIITGNNKDVTLIGNNNMWIQVNVAKLIVNTGISFLTTSQSGIYSTIDYAYNSYVSRDVINDKVVMPINMRYGLALLGYGKYFDENLIVSTGQLGFMEYYSNSIFIFIVMILSVSFLGEINIGTRKNILVKYKRANTNFFIVILYKFFAITILVSILSIPLIMLLGGKYLLISIMVSSVVFFINSLSENTIFNSILLIVTSFLLLLISGGIIPLMLLPRTFNFLSKLTINYHLLRLNEGISYFYLAIIFIVLNGLSFFLLLKRRDN